MTLQPPPGYGSGQGDSSPTPSSGDAFSLPVGTDGYAQDQPDRVQPPTPAPLPADAPEDAPSERGVPDSQLGNPDGAWLRVLARQTSPSVTDMAPSTGEQGVAVGQGGEAPAPSGRVEVVPARRRPSPPPLGVSVVGGRTVKLHRVAALDRLASGVGYLTVEWLVRRRGLDLLALQDGSSVTPRGNTLTVDMTQPMNRVLIATGTQGTMPLPPSEMRVSNGSTQVIVPIDGGTSLGVWPRLTLTRVDEFVVIRHEHDPLSGVLGAVASAYGYDERSFAITHTHLLG